MDGMTLDEAIKHCEEVAEQNETSAITYKNCKEIKSNLYEKLVAEKAENDCRECAEEHRQLAEWLMEVKDLREENKQLKRILKVAISNIYKKCSCENSDCDICETETTCDYDNRFTWKLKKEAFDLIYKRGDKNDD